MEAIEIALKIAEIACVVIVAAVWIIKLVKNEERSAREWLLLAVTEAEKQLGSGTGQLKLRAVFQKFIKVFPLLSCLISFERFSEWVDDALTDMKHLLEISEKTAEYVSGSNDGGGDEE